MRLPRRRRLEWRTDYKARLKMLEAGKPRLAVRKTNRGIIAQIVASERAQDKVITGTTSKALLALGWPAGKAGSLKSLAACYLTGLLIGKQAKKHKISEIILDIGIQRNIQKGRIYALVKGFIDSGCNIPHGPEVLPTLEQIEAKSPSRDMLQKLKEKITNG